MSANADDWNGADVAITRRDVLFIIGFLAGGRSDPILLALVDQLEARWQRPAPERSSSSPATLFGEQWPT